LKKIIHKRFLLTAVNLLILVSVYTQDLSGYWQGVFVSDLVGLRPGRSFFMNMVLRQNDRKIEGRFGNSQMDFKERLNVVYEISGLLGKKDRIPSTMMVGRILYNDLPGSTAEVFQQFEDIHYFKNDSMEVLYGSWTGGIPSPRGDGMSGSFRVVKLRMNDSLRKKADSVDIPTALAKRKNIEQGHVVVHTKKITLNIYDNGVVDDDSISIFLNGKLVLSHQRVSEKPIVLNIELDEQITNNEITLFAENLGSITPNTALVIITAGDKRYELFARSGLETNAVLAVEYRPEQLK